MPGHAKGFFDPASITGQRLGPATSGTCAAGCITVKLEVGAQATRGIAGDEGDARVDPLSARFGVANCESALRAARELSPRMKSRSLRRCLPGRSACGYCMDFFGHASSLQTARIREEEGGFFTSLTRAWLPIRPIWILTNQYQEFDPTLAFSACRHLLIEASSADCHSPMTSAGPEPVLDECPSQPGLVLACRVRRVVPCPDAS